MRLLGPVLGQAAIRTPPTAYLSLLCTTPPERVQLPPAPEELQGQDIDIEYVSPLAKAQKLTDSAVDAARV
jgi:hypothetical protein